MTTDSKTTKTAAKHSTREAWMQEVIAHLVPKYVEASGLDSPKVRVSVGRTSKKRAIGECWHAVASKDATREIFIRPDQDDAIEVCSILAHELVHAFLPPTAKHGAQFARLGTAVGLVGKPTEMGAGPELRAELAMIVEKIGEFPHAALAMQSPSKKQTTRMLKVFCEETGYTARMTAKWIDQVGTPLCPCCQTSMTVEVK